MRLCISLTLVILLGVAALAATPPTTYHLAFNDQEGTTRSYANVMKLTGTATGGGLSIPLTATVTSTTKEKVTRVKDGLASLTVDVVDGTIAMTLTDLPGADAEQTINQALPAFGLTCDRTAQGKVTNIKYTGEATQILGPPLDAFTSQLQTPGQNMAFPTKGVKIGESWDAKEVVDLGGGSTVQATAHYTFVGLESVEGKSYAHITCALTANADKIAINIGEGDQPMKATVTLALSGNEKTLFDIQAGQIFRSTFKGTINLEMPLPDGTPLKSTMTVNTTSTRGK